MDNENYIKKGAFLIARKIFNSEIWLNKPSSWKVIWIYILGNIAHEDSGTFKRGQGFFTFSRSLKDIGIDISQDIVKKSISFFKKNEMIRTRRSTRGMYIEVLKYNEYQSLSNYSSTNGSTKKALRKHQESTPIHKYVKNEKNISNKTGEQSSQDKQYSLEGAEVIKALEAIDPKNKTYYSNKTQRASADFLITEYGKDRVIKVIALLPKTNQMDFFPKITSPYDLKEKWSKLATSLQSYKNKTPIIL